MEAFGAASAADHHRAWVSQAARTKWYTTLLGKVADRLNLGLEREYLRVDYAMVDEQGVRRIFVESENVAALAHEEMHKLCSLAAPLVVLLTCVEWTEANQHALLERWRGIARAHAGVWPQPGLIGVCVAERCGPRFRLYTVAFDRAGDIQHPHRIALERQLV